MQREKRERERRFCDDVNDVNDDVFEKCFFFLLFFSLFFFSFVFFVSFFFFFENFSKTFFACERERESLFSQSVL